MAQTLTNIRIALRTDDEKNWVSSNPILNAGELAVVKMADNNIKIKVGNGIQTFNELQYLNDNLVATSLLSANEVSATSLSARCISQGYNTKSSPTSLATGILAEAEANFGVVHGIEAKIKKGDDYAFVFNGTNLPGIADRYTSHGEGTFNINPLSGLSGIYIGNTRIDNLLVTDEKFSSISASIPKKTSQLSNDSNFLTAHQDISQITQEIADKVKVGNYSGTISAIQTLSVINIAANDYYDLVVNGKTDGNTIYIVSSDFINAFGEKIENLAPGEVSSDAATVGQIPSRVSQLENDTGYSSLSDINEAKLALERQLSGKADLSGAEFDTLYSTNARVPRLSTGVVVSQNSKHRIIFSGLSTASKPYRVSMLSVDGSIVVTKNWLENVELKLYPKKEEVVQLNTSNVMSSDLVFNLGSGNEIRYTTNGYEQLSGENGGTRYIKGAYATFSDNAYIDMNQPNSWIDLSTWTQIQINHGNPKTSVDLPTFIDSRIPAQLSAKNDTGGGGGGGYILTVKGGYKYGSYDRGHVYVNGLDVSYSVDSFNVKPLGLGNTVPDRYLSAPELKFYNQTVFFRNGYCADDKGSTTTTYDYSLLTADTTVSVYHFYCLAAGTKILLADGSEKNIEDISYNDELLVWNFDEGRLDTAKPFWIKRKETAPYLWNIKLDDGTSIRACGPKGHEFFSVDKQDFMYGDELVGHTVLKHDGETAKCVSSSFVKEEVDMYNLMTDKHINCFANGVLAGCSLCKNLYKIENLKFVKEQKNLHKYEEFEGEVPQWWFNTARYAESSSSHETLVKYYADRINLMKW